jgi:hypothetical protein
LEGSEFIVEENKEGEWQNKSRDGAELALTIRSLSATGWPLFGGIVRVL